MNAKRSYRVALTGWMLLIVASQASAAGTWHVDSVNCPGPGLGTQADPFCSIQRGIDESVNGDEVVVAPGTYNETINLNGKSITLHSSDGPDVTIIDAAGLDDTVVRCTSAEGSATVIQGFTITGGRAYDGAGMANANSSPTVINCVFFNNVASAPNPLGNGSGGGMRNFRSSPTIVNCVFRQNKSIGWGGGAGMANYFSGSPLLINCTFFANDATGSLAGGGAMFSESTVSPIVTNSIFWGNSPNQIADDPSASLVSYSDVQGGFVGNGNISADPFFVDPDGPDDLPGTLDDNLRLLPHSPVIDAADNTALPPDTADLDGDNDTTERTPLDLDGKERFVDYAGTPDTGNGTPPIVDMGAFEFQPSTIPAMSEPGLVVIALLLVIGGMVIIRRRRLGHAAPAK